jgi:hypothetical protein
MKRPMGPPELMTPEDRAFNRKWGRICLILLILLAAGEFLCDEVRGWRETVNLLAKLAHM